MKAFLSIPLVLLGLLLATAGCQRDEPRAAAQAVNTPAPERMVPGPPPPFPEGER